MATHSPARAGWPSLNGLKLLYRGKVRDTYELTSDLLLVVATDGISIFDFVLNALVPQKGIILNAMNHFWLTRLSDSGFSNHFVAAGAGIDKYLPEALRNNIELQSRAMVVRRLDMAPVEFVFRLCLTGSGLKSYNTHGTVCGQKLPAGLQDGDELPYTLFTPTTKEDLGHDKAVEASDILAQYSLTVSRMLQVIQMADLYARTRGIKLADTKFEGDEFVLGDEVLTPDSSRFWDLREWEESRRSADGRKAPSSQDKELVRIWGKSKGINDLDPEKPEDVAKVHAMVVPEDVIRQTTDTYRYIFWRLTGRTIERYLREEMNVSVSERPKPRVLVICGSESDLPQVKVARERDKCAVDAVHIMSCHRNPMGLFEFVRNGGLKEYDVVIGAGSKALALPGIIDAWAYHYKQNVRVAGVALGQPGSEELRAAQLSITQLPGQPVVFNEMTGEAYTGVDGLLQLFERIMTGELPPLKPRKEKPVRFSV